MLIRGEIRGDGPVLGSVLRSVVELCMALNGGLHYIELTEWRLSDLEQGLNALIANLLLI